MTTHRRSVALAFLVTAIATAAVAFAACSGGGGAGGGAASGGSGAGSAPTADDLEGRTFLSTAVEGYQLVPDSRIRIRFDGAGLSASAGCNTMGGPFTLEGGTLTTGALMMTEMACEEPLMAQDGWLAGILKEATLDLAGDTLILAAGETRIVLGDEQALVPDRPLEGTTWLLDTILTGEAASSVPAGVEATLRIAEGRIDVLTGCNGGRGTVQAMQGGTLKLGPIASTKVACEPDRMALESTIFGVVTDGVPYAIDGDRLTLGVAPIQLVYRAGE